VTLREKRAVHTPIRHTGQVPRRPGRPTARPSAAAWLDVDGPLRQAVERVGDRWVLLIVGALLDGPRRFGELGDQLGVAPNILARRLRELEADGVVVSTPYSQRPVRLSYDLTAGGRELAGAVRLLAQWGAGPADRRAAGFHAACGSPVELRPWCPTCDRLVDDDETSDHYDV
jgi:DNA-binding HxlR family transcriptional regulator